MIFLFLSISFCIQYFIFLILVTGLRLSSVQRILGQFNPSMFWYGCCVSRPLLPNLCSGDGFSIFPPLSFSAGLLYMFRPHCVSWELPGGSGCVCAAVGSWLPLECFPQSLEFLGVSTCVFRCVTYELCSLLL